MHRIVLPLLVLATALACRGGVGARAATTATAEPRAALAALEERLAALIDAGDTTGLDALLAPEFALVGQDTTRRVARGPWIANTARLSFDSVRVTVGEITVRGDSAVVGLQMRFSVAGPGVAPASERYELADTWLRHGASWRLARRQLLARQTTPR